MKVVKFFLIFGEKVEGMEEVTKLSEFEYWDTFSVRHWYHVIGPSFTFQTAFCAVERHEAETILELQTELLAAGEDALVDLSRLDGLRSRLAPLISGNVFVKCSDRSGKDAAFTRGRIEQCLKSALQNGAPKSQVAVYRAMMKVYWRKRGCWNPDIVFFYRP
jgi:hypothetical protein